MLGSTINPTINDPAKKPTSTAITVSTQVITGGTTREREASSASMPRPVIHQKMTPTNGQLIARQNSGSIRLGTEARCASPTNPLGMFSNAGVVRRGSARVRVLRSLDVGGTIGVVIWNTGSCTLVGQRACAAERNCSMSTLFHGHSSSMQSTNCAMGSTHRIGTCAVRFMGISAILRRSQGIGN